MAMHHLGRSTTAFSRALPGFAVARPAARHLSSRALNQITLGRPWGIGIYLGFSAALIFDYCCYKYIGKDLTGRWQKLEDKREEDRRPAVKWLGYLKADSKELETELEEK